MCKSTPSTTTNNNADVLEQQGVHIAEWHSNLHTSGACVIVTFIIIILCITLLIYCFRHKLCHTSQNNERISRFEHLKRSMKRERRPQNEVDFEWKLIINIYRLTTTSGPMVAILVPSLPIWILVPFLLLNSRQWSWKFQNMTQTNIFIKIFKSFESSLISCQSTTSIYNFYHLLVLQTFDCQHRRMALWSEKMCQNQRLYII